MLSQENITIKMRKFDILIEAVNAIITFVLMWNTVQNFLTKQQLKE